MFLVLRNVLIFCCLTVCFCTVRADVLYAIGYENNIDHNEIGFIKYSQTEKDTLEEKSKSKKVSIDYTANVVCEGGTVTLTANTDNAGSVLKPRYEWSTGDTTESIMLTQLENEQTCILSFYDENRLIGNDTIIIYVTNLPTYTVVNDTICKGMEATVGITSGKYWVWSTNGTTQYINTRPLQTTAYTVRISNYQMIEEGYKNECFVLDSTIAVVNNTAVYTIEGDSTVCANAQVRLSVDNASDILWQDLSTGKQILVDVSSDTCVSVLATDKYGCRRKKEFCIKLAGKLNADISVSEDSICLGDELILTINYIEGDKVIWYTGETTDEINIIPKLDLLVYCDIFLYNDDGSVNCYTRIFKPIFVRNCSRMYFPTGFVIDGFSKEYGPIGEIEDSKTYYFAIFNAMGTRVFETTDLNIKWDGTYKGRFVQAGVYAYYYKENYDRFVIEKKGIITVIR